MTSQGSLSQRIPTGVRNLDTLLGGGIPKGTMTVLAGPPGSGKTVLAQQISFHNASETTRVIYFGTLSEPTAKTLRFLQAFRFFDQAKLGKEFQFLDLGEILHSSGLEGASALVLEHIKRLNPAIVVIDSFKVFDDLAKTHEELRKFSYSLAVDLMAWETTSLLLGEYATKDIESNPLFSVVDGLIMLNQQEASGEQQRFIRVMKMRGTAHSRDEFTFSITDEGIAIYAPRMTLRRSTEPSSPKGAPERQLSHVAKLDELLGGGIPRGSSLLVSGVAGSGKTTLMLELVYRGAAAGEKGVFFSFEETPDRLLATAEAHGWDLRGEIARGMVELVFVPQPDVLVEADLLMIHDRVQALGARWIALDSASVFLHKVRDPQTAQEKLFQLATIVQNAGGVGLFATDIPYGSSRISRFGVEETVVDGVLLLSLVEEGLERRRYLEVYKLRNTAHLAGRHRMTLGAQGLDLFPRYAVVDNAVPGPPPALAFEERLSTGTAGLDPLVGGGVFKGSLTAVSGPAGIGKTTLGLQFLLEGARCGQPGVCAVVDAHPEEVRAQARSMGLALDQAIEDGALDLFFVAGESLRSGEAMRLIADRIAERGAARVLIDGVSQVGLKGLGAARVRELVRALVVLLRTHGVTALLAADDEAAGTCPANELGSAGNRLLAALADNVLTLRFVSEESGALRRVLTVLKSRGSEHELRPASFQIIRGGLRVSTAKPTPARRGASKARAEKGAGARRRRR